MGQKITGPFAEQTALQALQHPLNLSIINPSHPSHTSSPLTCDGENWVPRYNLRRYEMIEGNSLLLLGINAISV